MFSIYFLDPSMNCPPIIAMEVVIVMDADSKKWKYDPLTARSIIDFAVGKRFSTEFIVKGNRGSGFHVE